MNPPLIAYPLVAVVPLAAHWSALFGKLLLEPVRTSAPLFDQIYNRWPWLLSILSGLFLAVALAVQALIPVLAYVCLAAGLTLLVVDLTGVSISLYRWARKRR